MYQEDSFFTLTLPGQFGVLCISLALSAVCLWAARRMAQHRPWWLRLMVGAVVFFLFIWLAPQVYYTLYVFILEDLPWQVVVQQPPSPTYLAKLMLFADNFNLSFHGQGLLGWLILGAALFSTQRRA